MTLMLSLGGLGAPGLCVDSAIPYYGINDISYDTVYDMAYADRALGAVLYYFLVKRFGDRLAMCVGSASLVVGYAVQMFYQFNFAPLILGGMLVDSALALLWITIAGFTARWFDTNWKSKAFGIIFLSGTVASIVVFLLLRFFIDASYRFGSDYMWFLIGFLVLAVVNFIVTLCVFEDAPQVVSAVKEEDADEDEDGNEDGGELVSLAQPRGRPRTSRDEACCRHDCLSWLSVCHFGDNHVHVVIYIVVYVVQVSGIWTLTNLVYQIPLNHGYDHDQLTIIGAIFAGMSLPSPVITGIVMDLTKAYRVIAVVTAALTAGAMFMWATTIDVTTAFYVAVGFLALATGSYTVCFYSVITELSYPMAEIQVSMIVFVSSQLSGLLGTILTSNPTWSATMMWVFCGISSASFVVLLVDLFYPAQWKRLARITNAKHRVSRAAHSISRDAYRPVTPPPITRT